jgi:hypothetical protein
MGIVLISGNAARSIFPEQIFKDIIGLVGRMIKIGKCKVVMEVLATRSKTDAMLPGSFPISRCSIVVATATDLYRTDFGTTGRIDNGCIGLIAQSLAIAIPNVLVVADMLATRSMARFARDAKLGNTAIGSLPFVVETGDTVDAVAIDAVAVPVG